MSDTDVLNPELYFKLGKLFGIVQVIKPGQPVVLEKSTAKVYGSRTTSFQVTGWGETYTVCCPTCGDSKYHLYFSHAMGGLITPKGRKSQIELSRYLVKCFKGGCHRTSEFVKWIQAFPIGKWNLDDMYLQNGVKHTEQSALNLALHDIYLPLGTLSILDPSVPQYAVNYLLGRGFDLQQLADQHYVRFMPIGCSWVNESTQERCQSYQERILIPIIQGRRLVYWQARKIKDTDSGPKYINPAGVSKGSLLYNLDQAILQSNPILVEGITDVWRIGLRAICPLGKELSDAQVSLMRLMWGWGTYGQLVIIVDGDDPTAKDTAYKNQAKLLAVAAFPRGVSVALLPNGFDPANLTTSYLLELDAYAREHLNVLPDVEVAALKEDEDE